MLLLPPAAPHQMLAQGFAQTIEFRIVEIVGPLPPPLFHGKANMFSLIPSSLNTKELTT